MANYRYTINPHTGKLQKVLSDEYIQATASALTVKEGVPTVGDLPSTGNVTNDARFTNDNHHLYIWDGASWQDQGDVFDITWGALEDKPSSTVGDIDDAVTKKHNKLHSINDTNDHIGLSGTGIEDNFMAIDVNGLPKDAGKNASDFANASHTHNEVDILDLSHYDSADFATDFGLADLANLTGKSYNDLTDKPDLSDLHSHGNKSELDLITDGDHDVREDNPHNISSDQVSFTETGFSAINIHDAITELDSEKAPTTHTHVETDITDLDHDAIKINGIPVDAPVTGEDGEVLTYNESLNKYELQPAGAGDMLKSVYDIGDNGIIDNSEKLEGSTKAEVQNHTPQAHTHNEVDILDLDHYDSTDFDTDFATKNINDLLDVDFDTGTPSDNQVLTYDSASGKWKAETPVGGTGYWELDGSSDLMSTTLTRDIVPRADNEGGIGTTLKRWISGWFNWLNVEQYIDFTNSSNPAHSEGRVFYDNTEHALSVYNENSEVTHQLGQEFLVRVKNETGSAIADGKVVKVVGASGDFPLIALAQADTLDNANATLGITTCNIPDTNYGYVTLSGKIHNLDTTAFSSGDKLYLSDTVAGGITNVRPDISVVIGYCVEVGTGSTGSILIAINNLIEITYNAGITYVESAGESTTTDSVNWQEKLSFGFTPPAPGDYIIHWSAELANTGANKGTELQIQLDDTEEINYSVNAPIVANGYANITGFKKITLGGTGIPTGGHTIDIDFRVEGTGTSKIRRARLMIRKA